MEVEEVTEAFDRRSFQEFFFVSVSLILAFGILQTTGELAKTEKPVVSVTSCSMYPQLKVGDIMVVNGRAVDSLEKGDIVVYDAREAVVEVNGQKRLMAMYNSSRRIGIGSDSVEMLGVGAVLRDVDTDPEMEELKFVHLSVNGRKVRVLEGRGGKVAGTRVSVEKVGSNIPVVHRVVSVEGDTVETRGDNNEGQIWFEKSVSREQIYGRVAFAVPRVGGLKILVMDLIGFNGDRPLVIDAFPDCTDRT